MFMKIRLDVNDMLQARMPHNDTTLLLWGYPYKEQEFEECQNKYLVSDHESQEVVKKANQELRELKQMSLMKFLEKEKYFYVKICKDVNFGPRAIAQWVFGTQEKHAEVREKIYQ